VLHSFEADVHCEGLSARVTREPLNVAILVVTQTPLDDLFGLAEQATMNVSYGFDNPCFNLLPYRLTDLNCPDVFALDISMNEIKAST
jgi:hypothetical protein